MPHLRTVSSQFIVSKIARTFKPPDSSWIQDCIEDIGWAIQAIGYHAGFEHYSTPAPYITVTNHRGKIPCEVDRLKFVERMLPDKPQSNVMNPDGTTPPPPDPPSDHDTGAECVTYKGIKLTKSDDASLEGIWCESPRTTNVKMDQLEDTYTVSGDGSFVVTQFEQGLIKLHYIGFIVDKKGQPCVVDDFHYKTCLEFYCVAQMMLRGFKHPEIGFKECMQMFERERDRAENACKMMGLDDTEKFEASWLRYVRSANFANGFYAGLEQQEYISL